MSESRVNGRGTASLSERLEPWLPERFRSSPVVPVVRLAGVIGAVTPLRPGMTLAGIAKLLDRAFGMRNAEAVAIVVNSPGGSPVQSRQIFLRIRQLSAEKKLPVLMFVEDVAASGGYMIACAGDEIFCDPSSIIGSIGVVGATFGLQEAIRKLGIERRVYTAGDRKVQLDPFLPEDPDDVARIKAIQREIHGTFIALVKERRAGKLKAEESNLFSGEYWAGETAILLGLVDGFGDLRSTLRARYGEKVRMPVIAAPTGLLAGVIGRRGGGAEAALDWPDQMVSALEARAIWAKFGL